MSRLLETSCFWLLLITARDHRGDRKDDLWNPKFSAPTLPCIETGEIVSLWSSKLPPSPDYFWGFQQRPLLELGAKGTRDDQNILRFYCQQPLRVHVQGSFKSGRNFEGGKPEVHQTARFQTASCYVFKCLVLHFKYTRSIIQNISNIHSNLLAEIREVN